MSELLKIVHNLILQGRYSEAKRLIDRIRKELNR